MHLGGYELRCQSVVEGMRATGCDVRILTSRFGTDRYTPSAGGAYRDIHVNLGPPYPPEDMCGLLRAESRDRTVLHSVLRDWQPDVIDIWGMEFASQSLVRAVLDSGFPVHLAIDDVWLSDAAARDPLCGITQFASGMGLSLDGAIAQLCCQSTSPLDASPGNVTFVSTALARYYETRGFRHPQALVRMAGIDTTLFSDLPRPSCSIPFEILSVGQLTESRGQADLVRAASIAADRTGAAISVRLVGAGNAEHMDDLRRLGDSLETARLTYDIDGPVAPDDVGRLYASAHLFVHTSRLPEGLPRVLMEAMSAGVPIISTDTGGQRDILDDGRWGELVKRSQPNELADRIADCIQQYDKWRRRSDDARQHALRSFRIETYVQGHMDDLSQAIAASPNPQCTEIQCDAPSHREIEAFAHLLAKAAERAATTLDCSADPDGAWRIGVILKRCGRIESANRLFLRLLGLHDDNATHHRRATFHLAELAMIDSRWRDARDHLARCLAAAPDHAKAGYDLEYAERESVPPHLRELAFDQKHNSLISNPSRSLALEAVR